MSEISKPQKFNEKKFSAQNPYLVSITFQPSKMEPALAKI